MRILFLDIDGVLNNTSSMAEGVHLIPEKLIMLRELCTELDFRIVISSSWRILHSLEQIHDFFHLLGFPETHKIIDVTRRANPSEFRGHQIEDWLLDNPQVHRYVIIDDDSDMLEYQKSSFVHINRHIGLSYRDINDIRRIFNGDTK